jgi:hypothetical protein
MTVRRIWLAPSKIRMTVDRTAVSAARRPVAGPGISNEYNPSRNEPGQALQPNLRGTTGMTGDVYGAIVEVTTTAVLVACALAS